MGNRLRSNQCIIKQTRSLSGEPLSFILFFIRMRRRNAMLPNSRKARELARARREMAKEEAADMVPVPESESDEQQDEEEEGVYEVERIVDHRMSRRYPVKC